MIEFIITEGLKDAYEVMETSKDEEANTLTCNIEEVGVCVCIKYYIIGMLDFLLNISERGNTI